MSKAKILLVDDDPDFILAIQAILENDDYEVVSAMNREEGMEKLKSEKPDLAVLDVMMERPNDGFEMSRQIREDESLKSIPLIMLTSIDGLTGINFKAAMKNDDWLPVDSYLEKPVEPEAILTEIKNLLAKIS
jgi:CheY-like chemotaxis protein